VIGYNCVPLNLQAGKGSTIPLPRWEQQVCVVVEYTDHKFGGNVGALFTKPVRFVFLVTIIAGSGWGVWKAGSSVFRKFNNDDVMQNEEGY
jgi:hypothetical protein